MLEQRVCVLPAPAPAAVLLGRDLVAVTTSELCVSLRHQLCALTFPPAPSKAYVSRAPWSRAPRR